MVVRCCVPKCNTIGTNGLHCFPANEEIRKKWMILTNTLHLQPTAFDKVCRKHFKDSECIIDFDGKKRLKKNALPSLFLPDQVKLEHNYALEGEGTLRQRSKPNKWENVLLNHKNDSVVNGLGNEVEIPNSIEPNLMVKHDVGRFLDINYVRALEKQLLEKKEENSKLKYKLRYKDKKLVQARCKVKDNKINDEKVLKYFKEEKKNTKDQLEFQRCQLRNSGRPPHGRRYSPEEKSLFLAMYKQGPRAYRFNENKSMISPTLSTLTRHSADLFFKPGINTNLFAYIKERVKNWPKKNLACTISWDEKALKAGLEYSKTRDEIEGFVEMNSVRRPKFATHALTFMIRGIFIPFKQPLTYYYTHGIKAIELAELVEVVTEAALDTGLDVLGSVCDQVVINESTVHRLMDRHFKRVPGGLLKYKIREKILIHCYDLPHLEKVVRNNFEHKNILHCIAQRYDAASSDNYKTGELQEASWVDVENVYKIDTRAVLRMLPKITDEHIHPDKLKMRVSLATQIFSESYGTAMLRCVEKKQLPVKSSDTAKILHFFNDVFDSLNGSSAPQSDTLKGPITEHSEHFAFWNYALLMLSKMHFLDNETGAFNTRSTVFFKFQSTIRGYEEISRICLNMNIEEVALRNANQDGLENFFGCVLTCCQIASTPTAPVFRTGYSTMIFNNLTGARSISANCEQDSSFTLLDNIHDFLLSCKTVEFPQPQIELEENQLLDAVVYEPQFSESDLMELTFSENESLLNISSVICRKMLTKTDCLECRSILQTNSDDEIFDAHPSETFTKNCKKIFTMLNTMIPQICAEKSIHKTLLSKIDNISEPIGCLAHNEEITLQFKSSITNYALNAFCKNINCLLKNPILLPNSNLIQDQAISFRKKKKQIGKYSDIFKA